MGGLSVEDRQQRLERDITQLRSILRQLNPAGLLKLVATNCLPSGSSILLRVAPLASPYRQYFFLLGHLYTTNPESQLREYTETDWKGIQALLTRIYDFYTGVVSTPSQPVPDQQEERVLSVAGPTFLHYFNTAKLCYEEQTRERLTTWFGPFEDIILRNIGIGVADVLAAFDVIVKLLQTNLDRAHEMARLGRSSRNTLARFVDEVFTIPGDLLEQALSSDKYAAFLDQFVSRRVEGGYWYPTDPSPAERRPLFEIGPRRYICPVPKQLLEAALQAFLAVMRDSEVAGRFLEHRDRSTEGKAEDLMRLFLPGEVFTGVFEAPNSTGEHDLIVRLQRSVLVIEVKASPFKEPLRDTSRAYERIRRDFNSDRGIQKAYNQGLNLKRYLLGQQDAPLFDRRGRTVTTIQRDSFDEIFIMVVTADDFGVVATDLSLLLQKPKDEPFPWAVNLFALETILQGFFERGVGVDGFLKYLRERAQLHGKVFCTDELEVAGLFLENGGLGEIIASDSDFLALHPACSDIFDRMYGRRRGVSVPDVEEGMTLMPADEFDFKTGRPKVRDSVIPKVGRNQPCPCGSGKKYKHCHGK
jgi:hypothetical protein